MGKVKVTSRNNQVKVQIRSSNGEQLNQNMAAYLSSVNVEGFLPFYIVTNSEGFTAEYGAAGFETAKDFFKNRVIDQNTFYNFIDSSVKALSGMSAYNMEYGNVLVSLDTVLVESRTGGKCTCIIRYMDIIMATFLILFRLCCQQHDDTICYRRVIY